MKRLLILVLLTTPVFAGLDAKGGKVINVATATDSTDAANKQYVDDTTVAESLWFNVKDFGAVGDNSNDDTSAIQAAIDAAAAAGGGKVVLPIGTYKITAALKLPSFVHLEGYGYLDSATNIKQYTNSIPVIIVGYSAPALMWSIKNLMVGFNTQQTSSGGTGIQLGSGTNNAYNARIEDVYIDKSYNGIETVATANCWMLVLDHVKVVRAYNRSFSFEASSAGTTNLLIHCYAVQIAGSPLPLSRAFYIRNQTTFTMINCAADNFGIDDIYAIFFFQTVHGTCIGTHIENNDILHNDGHGHLINIANSNMTFINTRIDTVTANATGGAWLFYVNGDNARLIINGLIESNTSVTGTYFQVNAVSDSEIYITNWQIGGTTPTISVSDFFPYRIKLLNNVWRATQLGLFHTFSDADATPSVSGGLIFKTYTNTLTITDFANGTEGQEITIISKAAITFDTTGTNLTGSSVDLVTATGDTTRWICEDGTTWRLIAFVADSGKVIIGSDPPATASATGTAGTITYDSDWFYVAVATDTWKRTALSTWAVVTENVIFAGENVIFAAEQVVY